MESRSFFYTLFQLLLRPGYLIRDYISGKRQVSYPPVKMLFFVAVVYLILRQLFNPVVPSSFNPDEDLVTWSMFLKVFNDNPAWSLVFISPIMIFPTWLLFRFAPSYDHHTIPEGFFIQVFMSTLMLMIFCISDTLWIWVALLIIPYYVIAYKQLFGYGWFGTIWRTALCCVLFVCTVVVISAVAELAITREAIGGSGIAGDITIILRFFLAGIVLALVGYYISKRTALHK